MRKVMVVMGSLLVFACTEAPARGDSIAFDGGANFVNIQPGCGVVCVGEVGYFGGISFTYDTLSHQVANMSFDGSGLFGGGFSYAGVNVDTQNLDFLWKNSQAIVDLFVYNDLIPTQANPDDIHFEGTKPIELQCLTQTCDAAFSPGGFQPAQDSQSVADATWLRPSSDPRPTQTPEPGSLLLMGSGLVGLGFWKRRKVVP
jgi:hypothetical protein